MILTYAHFLCPSASASLFWFYYSKAISRNYNIIDTVLSEHTMAALQWSLVYIVFIIASKINIFPKGVYSTILALHKILAAANLLAHNNISQICYCGQISLQSASVNCSFSDNLTPLFC